MSFALKTLHYQPQHSERSSHDAPSQGGEEGGVVIGVSYLASAHWKEGL